MRVRPRCVARVFEIVGRLEGWFFAWVDCPVLEVLFGLRRRQAIHLLHGFGGCKIGRTFLGDQQIMLESLRAVARGEQVLWERRQPQDAEEPAQTPRRPHAGSMRAPALVWPKSVPPTASRMSMWYRDAVDLAGKLSGLVQIEARGFEVFRKLVDKQPRREGTPALEAR